MENYGRYVSLLKSLTDTTFNNTYDTAVFSPVPLVCTILDLYLTQHDVGFYCLVGMSWNSLLLVWHLPSLQSHLLSDQHTNTSLCINRQMTAVSPLCEALNTCLVCLLLAAGQLARGYTLTIRSHKCMHWYWEGKAILIIFQRDWALTIGVMSP